MKLIKWTMIISWSAAMVLLENIDRGTAGVFTHVALGGIALLWTGFALWIKYHEAEARRREKQRRRKVIAWHRDEENKRAYIRETMAV